MLGAVHKVTYFQMRLLRDIRYSIADTGDVILLAALVFSGADLIALYFSR